MSHVVVATYSHPRETFAQQQGFFRERILPMVQSLPGFVTGRWSYDAAASRTHSWVVFATEPDAQHLCGQMRSEAAQPNPFGVELVSLAVAEELHAAERD
jgi:hypothetical protein